MKIVSLLFTLQLAHAVKPMFFSGTQHFSVAETNVLPGRSLKNATFKVYFDKPVIKFDETDINIKAFFCGSSSNCTKAPANFQVLPVTAWQAIQGGQQYQFKLNTEGANMMSNGLSTVQLELSIDSGACEAEASFTNDLCEASAYTIYYADGLSFTSTTSIDEQQVKLNLNFNMDYFNLNGNYFPFGVTVNDNAASFGSYTMIMINNELKATYYGAKPSDKVCLKVTTTDLPAVGNSYGDYIIDGSYTPVCFNVSATPCATFTWSEWSGCTFDCTPSPKFAQNNTQTRDQLFPDNSDDDATKCASITQTQNCTIKHEYPCEFKIASAVETGTECHPNGTYDSPNDGDTCNSGRQREDCYCGNGCEADGNCCQSYYSKCLVDAHLEVKLFYKYAPCWEPHVCTETVPKGSGMPYCDATKTAAPNKDYEGSVDSGILRVPVLEGTCDPLALEYNITRDYIYRCTCFGVPSGNYTCDVSAVSGGQPFPGVCCGGLQAFAKNCFP